MFFEFPNRQVAKAIFRSGIWFLSYLATSRLLEYTRQLLDLYLLLIVLIKFRWHFWFCQLHKSFWFLTLKVCEIQKLHGTLQNKSRLVNIKVTGIASIFYLQHRRLTVLLFIRMLLTLYFSVWVATGMVQSVRMQRWTIFKSKKFTFSINLFNQS